MSELTPFDYDQLPANTASDVRAATERIKLRIKRSAEDIVAIGQDLIAVKERLEHGQFSEWLKAEFEMDQRTAQNFMRVATMFGKNEIISFFKPTVLYALAAPSTPEAVREEAVSRAEQGESLSVKEVQDLKRRIKEAEQKVRQNQAEIKAVNQEKQRIAQHNALLTADLQALEQQATDLRQELDNQEPERIEIATLPEGYASEVEAIEAERQQWLAEQQELEQQRDALQQELQDLATNKEKQGKQFSRLKRSREQELQRINSKIAGKAELVEAVSDARNQALDYERRIKALFEKNLADGFETWLETGTAPDDVTRRIERVTHWAIDRLSNYLAVNAGKAEKWEGVDVEVVATEAESQGNGTVLPFHAS